MTFIGEEWSITLGTWFGSIPVALHCTSVLPLLFQVILAQAQYNDVKYTGLIFCLYGPILLVTLFLSGLVQAFLCYMYGRHSTRILLWPLGGFPLSEGADGAVLQDFWIASIGTSAYIPQLFLWFTLMTLISPRGSAFFKDEFDIDEFEDGGITLWFATLGRQAILIDLVLIIFNALIPAFPFGGSYCLTACMVRFGYTVSRVANVVGYTGAIFGLAMMVYGGIRVGVFDDLQVVGLFLAGTFVLLTSGILIYMNDTGRIHQHALFCRECYKVDMDESLDADHCPEQGYQFDAMSSVADSLSADENARASRVAKDEQRNLRKSKKPSKLSSPNPKGSSTARMAPNSKAKSSASQKKHSVTRIPKNANPEAKRMPQTAGAPDPPGTPPDRGRPQNQEPIAPVDSPTTRDRKRRDMRPSINPSPPNPPLKRDIPAINLQSPSTTQSPRGRKQEDVQTKLPVAPFLTPPERDSPSQLPLRHAMSPSNRTPSRKKRPLSLSPHLIELPQKEFQSPWTAPSSPIPTNEKVEMQGVDRLRNKAAPLQPASAQQMSPTPSHSGRQKPTVKRHASLDVTPRDRFQSKFESPQRRHSSLQKKTTLRDLVQPTISPRTTIPGPPSDNPYSPSRSAPNQAYSPEKIARSPSQIRRHPSSLSPTGLPQKEFKSPWTEPSSPMPIHEKVERQGGVDRLRNKAAPLQPASAQQMSPTPSHSGRQKPAIKRHASLDVTPRDRFQTKLVSPQQRSSSLEKKTRLRDLVQPTISPRKNRTIPGPPSDMPYSPGRGALNQPYSPQKIARSPSQIRRQRLSLSPPELPQKEFQSPWTEPSSPIPTNEKVEREGGVDRLRKKVVPLQPASAQQMSPTPSHSGRQKRTVNRHASLDVTPRDRFQTKFESPQRRSSSLEKKTTLRDLVQPTISPRTTIPGPSLDMPYSPSRGAPDQPYSPQKIARSPSHWANSAKRPKSPPEVRSYADKPGKGRDPSPHSQGKYVTDPPGEISSSVHDSLFPPLTRAPSKRRSNVRRSDPKKKKKKKHVTSTTNQASELTAES